jgi:predicted small lipoprotein YifL
MKKAFAFALFLALLTGCAACGARTPEAAAAAAQASETTAQPTETEAPAHALTPYDEQWRHARGGEFTLPGASWTYTAFESQGYRISYSVTEDGVFISDEYNDTPDEMPEIFFMPETIDGMPVLGYGLRKLHFNHLRFPDSCDSVISMDLSGAQVLELGAKQPGVEQSRGSMGEYVVSPENPWLCDVDGVLFNKERTVLLEYPGGSARELHCPRYGDGDCRRRV